MHKPLTDFEFFCVAGREPVEGAAAAFSADFRRLNLVRLALGQLLDLVAVAPAKSHSVNG